MIARPLLGETAPWKERFRTPKIEHYRLAKADPARGLAVGTLRSPSFQVYGVDVPAGQVRQLTYRPHDVLEAWISADGGSIYYLEDEQGNELGHLVRVPFAGGEAHDITPELPPYTLRGFDVSQAGNRIAFNPVNEDGFQLYCIDLGPRGGHGPPRLIYRSPWETWESYLSFDGELAAMQSTERAGGMRRYSTLVIDTASGEQIAELWDGPEHSVEPVAFSPVAGDFRLLATTTRTGYKRPLIWNPRTGQRFDLALEELEGEVIPLAWSRDGERVLLNHFYRALHQLYLYDPAGGALTRLEHPGGAFGYYGDPQTGMAAFGPAGEIIALWQDSTHPLQLIALDEGTGRKTRTVAAASEVPPSRPCQPVTFTSSDGQEVQGWLGLPEGEGPFPTILKMHGGPHFVVGETFEPDAQSWLDHGFAYLTINFRGSTTFGSAFKQQIWGDVGHWELEDMVAARNWLVDQGIARADAILLHGWSYGGYLTLWGLARRPELWAGGMAMVAMADWAVNFEDASDALKAAFTAWFGGTPEDKPALFADRSPISHAADIRAPVLIVQGRNDTRTAARQIELFEDRMRSLGKEIQVEWFDAGHGVGEVDQLIGFQETCLRFAYRVLGKEPSRPGG